LAIDFGTTATAAAVRNGARGPAALMFADGSSMLSSSVFAQRDRLIVGAHADNLAELGLDAYEPTPKRRVGHGRIALGGREFEPAELIGAVLTSVLGEAVRQHNGAAPTRVVLTHPVSWRSSRRRVLDEAFGYAVAGLGGDGLPDPVFVSEPVAAAHWYARRDPPKSGDCFAVYDLGGGTFDAAVLRAIDGGFEVVGPPGSIDPLGGFDFDQMLLDYLGQRYIAPVDAELWAQLAPNAPLPADAELAGQRRRLQARVRLLKESLTTLPTADFVLPGMNDPVLVTRGEYEALIAEKIEATLAELQETIADAGLSPQDLTAIYRIGGAARTPLVGTALDRLQLPVRVVDHPKLVVAQGAATTDQPTPTTRVVPPRLEPAVVPVEPEPPAVTPKLESQVAPVEPEPVPAVARHPLTRRAFASVLTGVVLLSIAVAECTIPWRSAFDWQYVREATFSEIFTHGFEASSYGIFTAAVVIATLPGIGLLRVARGRGRTARARIIAGCALVSLGLSTSIIVFSAIVIYRAHDHVLPDIVYGLKAFIVAVILAVAGLLLILLPMRRYRPTRAIASTYLLCGAAIFIVAVVYPTQIQAWEGGNVNRRNEVGLVSGLALVAAGVIAWAQSRPLRDAAVE
jgi:hypothetical protein